MERNSINRLQFRHNPKVFSSSTEAIEAFYGWTTNGSDSLSLLAEPTVLLYHRDGDVYDQNPHVILAIGSHTNTSEGTWDERDNRYCFINIDEVRYKIKEHHDEFKKEASALTINEKETPSLALYAEKTDEGTILSGDVKTPHIHAYSLPTGGYKTVENNIYVEDGIGTDNQPGLFVYVDLEYNDQNNALVFSVSKDDGSVESKEVVKIKDTHVVAGEYKTDDESIHLELSDDSEVVIDCRYLLNEWTVDGGTKTPVILKKVEVEDGDYSHVNPYQDIISADVRLKDETMGDDGHWHRMEGSTNILNRTFDERALYVDGVASNIVYYTNGVKSNVQDKLDELSKLKISNDSNNIITEKIDGFFASSKLEYVSAENKLIFKVSGRGDSGQTIEKKTELVLNTIDLFKQIWYDSTTEELVIEWVNDKGETKYTRIPIGQMIEEWEPQNEGHSVTIVRTRNVGGKDKVSADLNIARTQPNNILQDINHELYVNGIASNIKYDITGNTNVKQKIDELRADLTTETNERKADVQFLSGSIDSVSAITNANIERIDNTIGTGFTDDPHDNITYKFEQEVGRATARENEIEENLNDEIARAEGEEARIDAKLDAEIARAEGEEARIEQKLDDEIARATAKDTEHDDKIGTGFTTDPHENITAKFNNEVARAEGEEARIDAKLDAEIARATANENTISGKLDTEITDRIADVDAEETRAIGIENAISGKLDTEIARSTNEDTKIESTIGTGFTDDPHANITAKFEELTSDLADEVQRAIDNENAISGKLDTEIARSTSKDNEHDANITDINTRIGNGFSVTSTVRAEINALSANTLSSIKDITSNNDSLTIVKSVGNDPTVDLEVNIYPKSGNTIAHIVNGDDKGLFNFVDLTYDSEHNELTFKKSLSDGSISVLPIQLESISFIDTVYYDAATEELVIIYYSGHERKEIRIPLTQLIDEWDVYNDAHSAVKLTKEWNSGLTKNILSAEVIVSDNADNILENIEGALFVSNSAITANTAAIAAEVQRATTRENEIEGHLNDEIARAQGAEANLQAAITAEETRATQRENTIEAQVEAEELRARDAEMVLEEKIGTGFTTAETQTVTYKFNALSNTVSQEITDRIADVDAEETRAKDAEDVLNGKIDTEINDRAAADSQLNNVITAETSRATSEEQRIEGKVNTESARSIAEDTKIENTIGTAFTESADNNVTFKFNALSGAINQEISDRVSDVQAEEDRATLAESILRTDLTSEENRATAAELELTNKIGTGFTTADTNNVTAKFNALSGAINQEISDRNADVQAETDRAILAESELKTDIQTEEGRAIAAENQLANNITAEQNRATAAETALSGKIDSDVTAERNRAQSAETELQTAINNEKTARETAINNEKTARENADSTLAANLDNEVTRATSQENIISGLVVTEKSRAENAESVLTTNLNTEKAARENTDTDLQGQITAEVTRAMSAETELSTAIASASTRIDSEETARANADTQLNNAIATEASRALAAESALRDSIDGITMEFVDSNTIDFTKSTAATGSNITADVKVPTSDNIIVVDQGIKANVNLTYDSGRNVLTFTKSDASAASGYVTSDIQLNAGSIIDEIRYDSGTKELVIRYHSSSSTAETITKVPVADMFNEWDVDNPTSNSAIELTKTSAATAGGSDKISGKVLISSLSNNILTIDSNALYVDGSGIVANSGAIASLRSDLTSEVNARTADTQTLTNRIATEETTRANADAALQEQVTAEITRAKGAESTLNAVITGETARAQAAENALDAALGNEITARTTDVSRIETALGNEITARTANDTALQTAINTEIARAQGAESTLNAAITAEIADRTNAIDGEATQRTTADLALGGRIDTLANSIGTITGDVSSLQTQITTNTSNITLLQTSAATNANNITSEANRAQTAETALSSKIDTDVTAERNRALSAETELQTAIDNETTRAISAETALSNAIQTISGSVGSLGTLTLTTTSGGATATAGTYNPTADSVINISIPQVTSMETLTFDTGKTSVGSYDGSVATTIKVPSEVTHLANWDSTTATFSIPGNINVVNNLTIGGSIISSGTITSNGAIYSSDINLKENIAEAEYIKRVLANKIKVKEFNFKDDPNKAKVYGIIAQDLEENGLGEIVYTKDDGFKAVDYTSLMMLKIAYLENENKILRHEFVDMNNKLDELMKKLDNKD